MDKKLNRKLQDYSKLLVYTLSIIVFYVVIGLSYRKIANMSIDYKNFVLSMLVIWFLLLTFCFLLYTISPIKEDKRIMHIEFILLSLMWIPLIMNAFDFISSFNQPSLLNMILYLLYFALACSLIASSAGSLVKLKCLPFN